MDIYIYIYKYIPLKLFDINSEGVISANMLNLNDLFHRVHPWWLFSSTVVCSTLWAWTQPEHGESVAAFFVY